MNHYDIRITLDINMSGKTEEEAIEKAIDYINDHSIDLHISDVEAEIDLGEDYEDDFYE